MAFTTALEEEKEGHYNHFEDLMLEGPLNSKDIKNLVFMEAIDDIPYDVLTRLPFTAFIIPIGISILFRL